MKSTVISVALAGCLAGPAVADPTYVWRPSAGMYGGQVLSSDAFPVSTSPEAGSEHDFRSFDFAEPVIHRKLSLKLYDRIEVDPAEASQGACQIFPSSGGYRPHQWIELTHGVRHGNYEPYILPLARGRVAVSVHCPNHISGETDGQVYFYDIQIVD